MTVGEDVYTELSGNGALTDLVGTRIHPNWLPQDVSLPAVSFMQVSETPQNILSGELALKNHRIQVDCWASSYSSAQDVAAAVVTAIADATLFDSYRLGQQDVYEPAVDIHRVSMDFSIWQ